MDIRSLVKRLEEAREASRDIDFEIGPIAGYLALDPPIHRKWTWKFPSGEVGYLPTFTGSLQAAYELSQLIHPDDVCGVTWEPGRATAQVGTARHEAFEPAIALCASILSELLNKRPDLG